MHDWVAVASNASQLFPQGGRSASVSGTDQSKDCQMKHRQNHHDAIASNESRQP
jgi:hypothetical protein